MFFSRPLLTRHCMLDLGSAYAWSCSLSCIEGGTVPFWLCISGFILVTAQWKKVKKRLIFLPEICSEKQMNLSLKKCLNIIKYCHLLWLVCMTIDTNDFSHSFISPQSVIAQAMTLKGIFLAWKSQFQCFFLLGLWFSGSSWEKLAEVRPS